MKPLLFHDRETDKPMEEAEVIKREADRRPEPRTVVDQYCSVEFSIRSSEPSYLFRIRDISPSGMGILVKGGSDILKWLKVNDILNLKYNPTEKSELPRFLKTKVIHITRVDEGQYACHHLVGLSILGKA